MLTHRQLFLNYLAQTSDAPQMLEIAKAEGIYIYDIDGKAYIDLISGISVSNTGHRHPKVVEAIKEQLDKYMHVMVYGEFIQSPQVLLAEKISSLLPSKLSSVYLVNSGAEATEGALKLAKRFTGRPQIVAFKNAYHGSTQGALSVMGNEYFKQPYRPLLPGITFIDFNNISQLNQITNKVACVITEPIQSESGVTVPDLYYMQELRKQCTKTGTLLILDEVQTGFGRTGKMFGFENFGITPDIITFAKGLGGGMPIGAFVSSPEIMHTLTYNPVLGHITTFGGHPVSAAAALASLDVIINEKLVESVQVKSKLFRQYLVHPKIKSVSGTGLFFAVELSDFNQIKRFIKLASNNRIITDWFLFADNKFRIAPPLIITEQEIKKACSIILKVLDEL